MPDWQMEAMLSINRFIFWWEEDDAEIESIWATDEDDDKAVGNVEVEAEDDADNTDEEEGCVETRDEDKGVRPRDPWEVITLSDRWWRGEVWWLRWRLGVKNEDVESDALRRDELEEIEVGGRGGLPRAEEDCDVYEDDDDDDGCANDKSSIDVEFKWANRGDWNELWIDSDERAVESALGNVREGLDWDSEFEAEASPFWSLASSQRLEMSSTRRSTDWGSEAGNKVDDVVEEEDEEIGVARDDETLELSGFEEMDGVGKGTKVLDDEVDENDESEDEEAECKVCFTSQREL